MIRLKTSYRKDGFTLIELMIVISIIALLAAIAIPNYIHMRQKGFCSQAETDASHIAAAISNYFGNGTRTQTPTIDDLGVDIKNSSVIIGGDPNILITIQVTDRTNRCPIDYQTVAKGWDGNYVFTKEIK